jgi:hypothetical protein
VFAFLDVLPRLDVGAVILAVPPLLGNHTHTHPLLFPHRVFTPVPILPSPLRHGLGEAIACTPCICTYPAPSFSAPRPLSVHWFIACIAMDPQPPCPPPHTHPRIDCAITTGVLDVEHPWAERGHVRYPRQVPCLRQRQRRRRGDREGQARRVPGSGSRGV